MDVLRYRGRVVSDTDVAFIRRLIVAHPSASRRALSHKLCEAWNWVQPNGVLRDMVCRGLMLALHRAGHIELPPARWANPLGPQRRTPSHTTLRYNPIEGRLGPPIQMCDALSRNVPKELKTILANCLAHGRRQFVEVAERFPEECGHLLETLQGVYKNDEVAKERNLSPRERLQFHQTRSASLMEDLQVWLNRQFEERLVEPNSPLGEAISYMLNHWEKLTLFLRTSGAPLDNNVCERALKKAILHRKNALFYKTENGAHVGDLFMSLIYTCQAGGVDPFDYLTALQRHAAELASDPAKWMPWNYRDGLRM